MNPLPFLDTGPGRFLAIISLAWGIALIWIGLSGGRVATRALARRHVPMLQRMRAFRRFVAGLVLVGVGGAVLAQAPWLLWLALGIGFVEILESSALIAVWQRRPPAAPRTQPLP